MKRQGCRAMAHTCAFVLAMVIGPALAVAQPQVGGSSAGAGSGSAGGAGAAAGGATAGGAQGSGDGITGGDLVIGNTNPALYDGLRVSRVVPKFHTVKEGDTLWTICQFYYGDAWTWPQLWATNEKITNPHWIYPGDKIKMIGGKDRSRRKSRVGALAVIRVSRHAQRDEGPLTLRMRAFVDPNQLEESGVIDGSRAEGQMLSQLDEIYVKGAGKFKPQLGETYSVYKVHKRLRSRGKVIGNVVEIRGSARVTRVRDEKSGVRVATAEIVTSRDVIERGLRVGPLRRTFRRLPKRPARENLKARLLDGYEPKRFFGQDDVVFVDRGSDDGVRAGNRFLVLRRGDGNRKVYQQLEKDNVDYPKEVVAEVSVVETRKRASVGVVTRARMELRRGDKLELRRGY